MTTHAPAAASPPQAPPAAPLTFDERLTLAVQAVDARIDTAPLDLADVVRLPVDTNPSPTTPRSRPTSVAQVLDQATSILRAAGWTRGARLAADGRMCLLGAIRTAAAGSRGLEVDAATIVLDAVRDRFGPYVETVPQANDQHVPDEATAVRILGDAAQLAHNRNQ